MMTRTKVWAKETTPVTEMTIEELQGILSIQIMALKSENIGSLEFFNEKYPTSDPTQAGIDAERLVLRAERIHGVVQEMLRRQRGL